MNKNDVLATLRLLTPSVLFTTVPAFKVSARKKHQKYPGCPTDQNHGDMQRIGYRGDIQLAL